MGAECGDTVLEDAERCAYTHAIDLQMKLISGCCCLEVGWLALSQHGPAPAKCLHQHKSPGAPLQKKTLVSTCLEGWSPTVFCPSDIALPADE